MNEAKEMLESPVPVSLTSVPVSTPSALGLVITTVVLETTVAVTVNSCPLIVYVAPAVADTGAALGVVKVYVSGANSSEACVDSFVL